VKIFISEFSRIILDHGNFAVPIPLTPSVAEQSIEIEMVSKTSEPFKPQTRFILVHTEAACSIAFGLTPEADQRFHKLGPGETRYYGINPGDCLAVVGHL
jgi:hypothetical protein